MIFDVENYATMQEAVAQFCRFLDEYNVPSERVFDSRLVINALIGNVLKHSDGKAKFHAEVKGGFVELLITAHTAFFPPEKSTCSDVYAEHGRGLYLVDAVCHERSVTDEGAILVKIKIR